MVMDFWRLMSVSLMMTTMMKMSIGVARRK